MKALNSFDVTSTSIEEIEFTSTTDKLPDCNHLSGLFFPENELHVVDRRTLAHHNTQWMYVLEEYGELSPVLPWATDTFSSPTRIEVNRSHGGLHQAITRTGSNPDIISPTEMKPEYVYAIANACRNMGVEPEAEIEYKCPDKQARRVLDTIDDTYSVSVPTTTHPIQLLYNDIPRDTNTCSTT